MSYKQLSLAVIIVLVSLLGWYFLRTTIAEDVALGEGSKTALLLLVIFGILFLFFALFVRDKIFIISAVVLAFSPLAFFTKNLYVLGACVILFLAILFSQKRVKGEKKRSITFSFWGVNHRGLGLYLTGLSLVLATVFAFSSAGAQFTVSVPKPLFDWAFDMAEPIVAQKFPGYYKNIKVDEFLLVGIIGQAEKMLPKIGGLSEDMLPEGDISKEMIQAQLAENISPALLTEQREKLSETFGIKIGGDEKLKDVFYRYINERFLGYRGGIEGYIPLVLIVIGFGVLKTVGFVLKPLMIFLGWILFKILVAFRFIVIKKKMVKKEIVTL